MLSPRASLNRLAGSSETLRAIVLANKWPKATFQKTWSATEQKPNRLEAHVARLREGPGVWKWTHYFDVYQRHLEKFVGKEIVLAEIGVYSGGSLPMWREYFGDRCSVIGIDIQDECKVYENRYTTIKIGDQGDRNFWKIFRASAPAVDILIDDGGHRPEQQMVTLEEMLAALNPGGVYICEDVHACGNPFSAFVSSLADQLNAFFPEHVDGNLSSKATPLQSDVHSVHIYPFAVVIERRLTQISDFQAPKRGTQWQPFLG